jgi:hypothetical protein
MIRYLCSLPFKVAVVMGSGVIFRRNAPLPFLFFHAPYSHSPLTNAAFPIYLSAILTGFSRPNSCVIVNSFIYLIIYLHIFYYIDKTIRHVVIQNKEIFVKLIDREFNLFENLTRWNYG